MLLQCMSVYVKTFVVSSKCHGKLNKGIQQGLGSLVSDYENNASMRLGPMHMLEREGWGGGGHLGQAAVILLGLIHLAAVVFQVEEDDYLAHSVVLDSTLSYCLLEIPVPSQHLVSWE